MKVYFKYLLVSVAFLISVWGCNGFVNACVVPCGSQSSCYNEVDEECCENGGMTCGLSAPDCDEP